MSKKSNNDLPWICLSGEIKKLKEYWCEVSKSNLPMMIIGDSGVGKSFWIQKSIDIKSESKNIQKIKIDYSVKEKWFDTINFQIKTDSLKVFWWENFNQANQEEIQKAFDKAKIVYEPSLDTHMGDLDPKTGLLKPKSKWIEENGVELYEQNVECHTFKTSYFEVSFRLTFFQSNDNRPWNGAFEIN